VPTSAYATIYSVIVRVRAVIETVAPDWMATELRTMFEVAVPTEPSKTGVVWSPRRWPPAGCRT